MTILGPRRFVDFVRNKIDDPLLSIAAYGARFIYRRCGVPPPDFTALNRLIGHSLIALGGLFQLAIAITHFQITLSMVGAMGVIVGLTFALAAYSQLASSTRRWDYRRFREVSAQAALNREKYLFIRMANIAIFLSLTPLMYWAISSKANPHEGLLVIVLQVMLSAPFLIVADFTFAAEPPPPDDGDFAFSGVPQAI